MRNDDLDDDLDMVVTDSDDRVNDDDFEDEDDDGDIDLSKVSLESIRLKNEAIAQRLQAQEQLIWQQKIDDFKRQYNSVDEELFKCEELIAKAIAEADGDSATKAIRYRDQCISKKREMEAEYANFQHQTKAQEEALAEAHVRKERYAKNFAKEVGWDKLSPDAQQKILEIDQTLSQSFDPSKREYFSFLKKKVQSIVDKDKNAKVKSAPKKNEFHISRERKEALIEAGVWDDPTLRKKYIKQYQKWDLENSGRDRGYEPY